VAGGETFARREITISALLVKEDFVLMTASSKGGLRRNDRLGGPGVAAGLD
jgi:hypothetical protein